MNPSQVFSQIKSKHPNINMDQKSGTLRRENKMTNKQMVNIRNMNISNTRESHL